MFTWRRNWRDQLSKPLQVDDTEIEIRNTTKFLGVTLDSKLSWNEHIDQKCKKAKGILLQCRRAIGPSWGFNPQTMKWIYTALVRPTLTYAAMTWINGLYKQHNLAKLKSVQRLANILITGALPSTPGDPLNSITNTIPIDLCIEEEAALGFLRLKSNNQWRIEPMINEKGNLTTHTKLCKKLLNGSKMDDKVGSGVYIPDNGSGTPVELAFHIGEHSTVFQAEAYAVEQAAKLLIDGGTKNKTIIINCDSQAAIKAVDSTIIKSKTTQRARNELHKLEKDNNVLLRTVWKNALRQRSHRKMRERWKDMPPHFRTVWRESYTKSLSNLGKNKLRAATQYLTGHCELNYHLNKYKPKSISKICPHCSMEEETMNHFIGQCPMWFNRRGRFFNCHYASVSEIADRFPLRKIVGYICSTNRFNQH
ncbi:hypothetical protein ACHWQZ_G013047 [Mnemiopsis leidyi]